MSRRTAPRKKMSETSLVEKFIADLNEKADERAKERTMMYRGVLAQVRASTSSEQETKPKEK